CQKYSSSPFTF
nr:immunoglobulin light chain junction region [Macaca mulatta]MOV34090.1 immunoglobulin light chain junction region [Macaca mulatta]MOV34459.1 immunoglobulin light chain junction region [Macaca mulatta]MOV34551.1 immunoglobulin light chain junction region [Macaca mulatta]MOV34733.1 immunoglobulin light chain junction region [Macaca mulatta]